MIDYVVYSLKDLMSTPNELAVFIKSFSNFKCEKNEDVENFLKSDCIKYEEDNNCRTFFILDKEKLKKAEVSIVAFFSIAITGVGISGVTRSKRRKLLGSKLKNKEVIPAYLIGQLGRNDAYKNVDLSGDIILKECYERIKEAQRSVGGRLMLIECKKEVLKFYRDNNFLEVSKEPGKKGLYQMYKMLV